MCVHVLYIHTRIYIYIAISKQPGDSKRILHYICDIKILRGYTHACIHVRWYIYVQIRNMAMQLIPHSYIYIHKRRIYSKCVLTLSIYGNRFYLAMKLRY